MKKILLFVATEKGYRVLQELISSEYKQNIGVVVSFKEIDMLKDYYADIKELCDINNISFFEWKQINNDIMGLIKDYSITECIAISWRYMLPIEMNKVLINPIIVFHDSLLPKYRGFAPVVTAMINGDSTIGATAFFAAEETDYGDIILQKSFKVDNRMYIQDVIHKMAELYSTMMLELMPLIIVDKLCSYVQDDSEATYSIWRDEDDYWIDWNKSAEEIDRFIRALGYPYKGAKTIIDGKVIRLLKCRIDKDKKFEIRTPGKIWEVCGGGSQVLYAEEVWLEY